MAPMRFHKYQAIGNDYLVLQAPAATATDGGLIRRLCDRHLGVGSDGVLLETVAADDAFGVLIVNPDGTPAGISGNGLRIFARWLFDAGRVGDAPFDVETPSRRVRCRVTGGGAEVEVAMGRASFDSRRIPVAGPEREVVDEPLRVGDERVRVTAVTVGNPHAVVPVAAATADLARRLGPLIERHAAFPERTNVQFVRVESRERVHAQIWERGAGYTLASGSSACAVAAALRRLDLVGPEVTVSMPGGMLRIHLSGDGEMTLRGAVAKVAEGVVADDLLAEVRGARSDVAAGL